jgi:hypothetical protein
MSGHILVAQDWVVCQGVKLEINGWSFKTCSVE